MIHIEAGWRNWQAISVHFKCLDMGHFAAAWKPLVQVLTG